MLCRLLQTRSKTSVILWLNFGIPSLLRMLSTSSQQLVRNVSKSESITKAGTSENDSELETNKTDNEPQEYAKESPLELLHNAKSPKDAEPLSPDDVWSTGHYPENSCFEKSQAKYSSRPPKIQPQDTSIIIFPGQGTQYVGMGKGLLQYPNVSRMYEAASQILGYDLLELCLNGPREQLNRTEYQQPAVLVASLAAVEKLREEKPFALESCVGVAGYSIGEITALTFAGSLSFEDAVRLVKVRGEAMQLASEMTPSGMMTVLYGPDSRLKLACGTAKEFCKRKGLIDFECRIASYLYPHCKVIAGNDEALEFVEDNKNDFRLKRLRRLPVSGAFHTSLMTPAIEPVKKILAKIQLDPPIIPVHSNVDGKRYKNVGHIQKQLPKQMVFPVKWEQTMHILYERSQGIAFPKTFECGPGKSLKTILKVCNAKAWESSWSIEA